jgi:hypothetical protein
MTKPRFVTPGRPRFSAFTDDGQPPAENSPAVDALIGAIAAEAAARAPGRRIHNPLAPSPEERLPEPAREKLLELRRRNDDAGDVLRTISARRQELHLDRQRAWQSLQRLENHRVGNLLLPEDHSGLVAARNNVAALDAQLTELRRREETAQSRRWKGLNRVEKWIVGLPAGAVLEIAEPPVLPRRKADAAAIDARREEIRRIRAEVHQLRSALVPASEAKERLRREIDKLAGKGAVGALTLLEARGGGLVWPIITGRAELFGHAQLPDGFAQLVGFAGLEILDTAALFCWLHRDALLERLEQEIDDCADDAAAISAADRSAKETGLLAALLEQERIEELLIELAASEGRDIIRRDDADPRAVLGVQYE